MLYEIINPSDPYTIECATHKVAAAACFLLGEGQYAFEPIDGSDKELRVPIFIAGGSEEWCQKTFGMSVDTLMKDVSDNHMKELIDALESCLIGTKESREAFCQACERIDNTKFKLERHDRMRTSLNDIGGLAYSYARDFREITENKGEANA